MFQRVYNILPFKILVSLESLRSHLLFKSRSHFIIISPETFTDITLDILETNPLITMRK